MRSKLLLALILFAGLAFRMNAQSDAKQQEPVKSQEMTPAEQEAFKNKLKHRILEIKAANAQQNVIIVQKSAYNNREAEILEKLNTDVIPESFPLYKEEYTHDQYTVLMNKWYAANPTLVKKQNTNEQK